MQQCAPGTQPRVDAPGRDLSGRSDFLFSLHQTEQLAKTDTLHPAGVRRVGKGEYTLHPLSRLPRKCTGSNVLFHTFTAQANTPDTQVVQDQASVRHFQSRHFKRCRQTGSLRSLKEGSGLPCSLGPSALRVTTQWVTAAPLSLSVTGSTQPAMVRKSHPTT